MFDVFPLAEDEPPPAEFEGEVRFSGGSGLSPRTTG